MKDTLEYKLLKYLAENNNGSFINVGLVDNKKNIHSELRVLNKKKFIEIRKFSNGTITTNIQAKINIEGIAFLKKLDSENITNNFSGATIGMVNQDSDLKDLIIDIKQTNQPVTKEKQQSAIVKFVEKWFWQILIPLLIGIVLIAIEKNWNIINNF